MAIKLKAPVDVQIELTQNCNWKCRHCYNYWRPNGVKIKSSKNLSGNELLHIVKDLIANEVPSITITGGEPFLRRKNLFVLLKMAQEAGIHASINTNLSLVRRKDINRLANEYKGVTILFSLLSADAVEHEHLAGAQAGTHAKVLENATLAIQQGLSVSLNMVLMHENLYAIEKTARLAKNLGVRVFCATKALPNACVPDTTFLLTAEEVRWSLVELMRVEQLLGIPIDVLGCYPRCLFENADVYRRFSHRTCVTGCTTATIGADGNVRACSHMEASYGNIFQESLSDIWQKMGDWREDNFIPEQCRDCLVVASCRGGCRVNTLLPGLRNMDVYAKPRNLKDISREVSTSQQEWKKDKIPVKVRVYSQTRFRSEAFGALICKTNPLSLVLVNHSAAAFLKAMAEKRDFFDLHTFLEQSGAKAEKERQSVEYLYRKLIRKGFLVP